MNERTESGFPSLCPETEALLLNISHVSTCLFLTLKKHQQLKPSVVSHRSLCSSWNEPQASVFISSFMYLLRPLPQGLAASMRHDHQTSVSLKRHQNSLRLKYLSRFRLMVCCAGEPEDRCSAAGTMEAECSTLFSLSLSSPLRHLHPVARQQPCGMLLRCDRAIEQLKLQVQLSFVSRLSWSCSSELTRL